LLFDKFLGKSRVGFALGNFHHLADEEADGFHLAVSDVFGGFGVFG
jgi:hypothetical protein